MEAQQNPAASQKGASSRHAELVQAGETLIQTIRVDDLQHDTQLQVKVRIEMPLSYIADRIFSTDRELSIRGFVQLDKERQAYHYRPW